MKKYTDFTGFILWLLAVMGTALFAGAFSPAFDPAWYNQLAKPSWTPPDAVFGPVWGLLYLLMTIAVWRVWRNGGWTRQRIPLLLFSLQLVFNAGWMALFFGLHAIGAALIEIILLFILIGATIYKFNPTDRLAALLLIPYLLWVGYAAALTFTIFLMNESLPT